MNKHLHRSYHRLALLWLVLGSSALPAQSNDFYETPFPLVISPVSYMDDPEPMELVRIQQIRETIDLLSRIKGFQPLYDFWHPRQIIDFKPTSSHWMAWVDAIPENTSFIDFTYEAEELEVRMVHYTTLWEESFNDYDREYFLDYAWEREHSNDVLFWGVPKEEEPIWADLEAVFQTGVNPEWFRIDPGYTPGHDAFNDWTEFPYWDRARAIGELLHEAFGWESEEARQGNGFMLLVDLARLHFIQAVYLASFDQVGSARHLGRSLLFADILHWANAEQPFARQVKAELTHLAKRFSEKTRLPENYSSLLPEARLLLRHEESTLADALMGYPAIESLFDYMIRVEVKANQGQRDPAINRYIHQREDSLNIIEKLLLSQKDFSPGMSFGGNQWLTNISNNIYRQNRVSLGEASITFILEALGENPSELLDTEEINWGYPDLITGGSNHFLSGSEPPNVLAWRDIASLRQLENGLKSRVRFFDPTFQTELEELFWEIRFTHVHYAKAISGRMRNIGASSERNGIQNMLAAYGLAGPELTSELSWDSRFYTSRRPNSRFQDELEAQIKAAKSAYFTGELETAVVAFEDLIPLVGDSDDDLMKIAFFAHHQLGRTDEGVEKIMKQYPSGFGKDQFRLLLLTFAPEMVERFPDFHTEPNTNSSRDYYARTDSHFRRGEYAEALAICNQYHYGESPRIALMRALCRWLETGEAPDDLGTLETQWIREINRSMGTDDSAVDHWVDILNDRLGNDPIWLTFKERTHSTHIQRVMRAGKQFHSNLAPEAVQVIHRELKAITDEFSEADYSQMWQHYALQYEHIALANALTHQTAGFSVGLEEAKTAVVELMEKTIRIMDGRSPKLNERFLPHPLETMWLHAALKAGAEPTALARFLKSIPRSSYFFQGEGYLFVQAIPRIPVMVEIFRRIPHEETTGNMWASPFKVDPKAILEIALEAELFDFAAMCALDHFDNSKDFSNLASYFASREDAVSWARDNAPDAASLRTWMRAFDKTEVETTTPLPLPTYYQFLSGKDQLQFVRL